jgi:hypothetical protein
MHAEEFGYHNIRWVGPVSGDWHPRMLPGKRYRSGCEAEIKNPREISQR